MRCTFLRLLSRCRFATPICGESAGAGRMEVCAEYGNIDIFLFWGFQQGIVHRYHKGLKRD